MCTILSQPLMIMYYHYLSFHEKTLSTENMPHPPPCTLCCAQHHTTLAASTSTRWSKSLGTEQEILPVVLSIGRWSLGNTSFTRMTPWISSNYNSQESMKQWTWIWPNPLWVFGILWHVCTPGFRHSVCTPGYSGTQLHRHNSVHSSVHTFTTNADTQAVILCYYILVLVLKVMQFDLQDVQKENSTMHAFHAWESHINLTGCGLTPPTPTELCTVDKYIYIYF